MKDNKLLNMSIDFSVAIVRLCDSIKGHSSLVNQLERAATSVGANIHEANYAQSKADFISKLQIALKECYETEYWLTLFMQANIVSESDIKTLADKCGTLRRILIASVNTSKSNN